MITSRITLGVMLVICAALVFSVYDRYVIERKMAERRADKEAELRELEERKADLEEKVEYLSHERGIEAEIRSHFDVAREGEQVVVLIEDEDEGNGYGQNLEASVAETKSFWSRWMPW